MWLGQMWLGRKLAEELVVELVVEWLADLWAV